MGMGHRLVGMSMWVCMSMGWGHDKCMEAGLGMMVAMAHNMVLGKIHSMAQGKVVGRGQSMRLVVADGMVDRFHNMVEVLGRKVCGKGMVVGNMGVVVVLASHPLLDNLQNQGNQNLGNQGGLVSRKARCSELYLLWRDFSL